MQGRHNDLIPDSVRDRCNYQNVLNNIGTLLGHDISSRYNFQAVTKLHNPQQLFFFFFSFLKGPGKVEHKSF